MITPSELQVLLMGVMFTPLIVWTFTGIDIPRRRWLAAALLMLLASYVATVAEGFAAPVLLNTVEHALFAGAAVCLLVVSFDFLRFAQPGSDGESE